MKRRSLLLPTIGTIHVGAFVIVAGLLCHVASAQEPDAPAGASVLQVHDAPDQIIHVTTRIRHTTVIQLPPHENILDFVVGDSEYWHLTGAANLAFLKPIGERRPARRSPPSSRARRAYQRRARVRERPDLLVPRRRTRRPAPSDCPRRRRPGHDNAGRRGGPRLRRALARGRVSAHGRAKPRGRADRADRRRGADRRDAPGRRRAGGRVSRVLPHALGVSLSAG